MRTDSKERKEKLRKLRLIAKSVFDGMEEVAKGEEKHIFLRSKVPRGGDARTEWPARACQEDRIYCCN